MLSMALTDPEDHSLSHTKPAPAMPSTKADYDLTRMYFRIDPKLRNQFRAVAQLLGDSMQDRITRLIRADIESHREAIRTAADAR